MTPLVSVLLFMVASAFGAAVRLAVGIRLHTWSALLTVNVVGSAVFGAVVGADPSAATVTVLGVGLCGSLTTFSSFALETRSLGLVRGGGYAVLTLGAAVGAAAVTSSW